MRLPLLLLCLALVACHPPAQTPLTPPPSPQVAALPPSKTAFQATAGQIVWQGQQLRLKLQLPPQSQFRTQKLAFDTAVSVVATASDSRGRTYTPVGATQGALPYPSNGELTLSFSDVLPDDVLWVELRVDDASATLPQTQLATALKPAATGTATAAIHFGTTPVAQALKTLLSTDPERARSLDISALQSLVNAVTGVSGTAPNLTYTTHPSLVKVADLAAALRTADPDTLTAADYRASGGRVAVTVNGLAGNDRLNLQVTDAASQPQTQVASHTFTGVTPGSGLLLRMTPYGTHGTTYNYTMSPASAFTVTEGQTTAITLTATPATPTLTAVQPSAIGTGQPLTLTGSNFHATPEGNTVLIGGQAATVLSASATELRVTVPPVALGSQSVQVSVGSQSATAGTVTVKRILYVNDTATGSNNGSSWANAYTSLQTALADAVSGDEIWVAAGIYKPTTTTNRAISFELKSGVTLYGGFADNNPVTDPSARNLAQDVSILSGDIDGNPDIYDTDPSNGILHQNNTGNSQTVVRGADEATLDGFTIRGGYALGAPGPGGSGISNPGVSPTLRNLIVFGNAAGTSAIACDGGSTDISDVQVLYNVSSNAAGMWNGPTSTTQMRRMVFYGNSAANGNGGGLINDTANPTMTDIVFANNYSSTGGGGMLNFASNPVMTQVVFVNNYAVRDGGGFHNLNNSQPKMINVTFANNRADRFGGALFTSGLTPVIVNGLFFNGSIYGYTLPTGQGNVVAASDPFIDAANPAGFDGKWFTNDDGLRPKLSASDVINQGISSFTGITFPTSDILGLTRPLGLGYEPGAYEFFSDGPFIETVSPATARAGDTVTLTGQNLGGSPTVTVAGQTATVLGSSATELQFMMPTLLGTGTKQIQVTAGSNSHTRTIQYLSATTPTLTSLSPASVLPGDTLIITGTNFSSVLANNAVTIGGQTAFVNSASPTQLQVTVPAGVPSGTQTVSVTVNTEVGTRTVQVPNRRIYVNDTATGADNGSSWANAYTSLQTALTNSSSGDEIWVAAGTYKPTTTTDRSISFQLKAGVSLYGGFADSAPVADPALRNLGQDISILSGDIDGSPDVYDTNTSGGGIIHQNNTNNTRAVVRGVTGATLDGFTIQGGYGDTLHPHGSAILNNTASPTLRNLVIFGNSGGTTALMNYRSQPVLENIVIRNNSAINAGGMWNGDGSHSTMRNMVISHNSSLAGGNGGGLINDTSNPTMTNIIFEGNYSTNLAGGLFNFRSSPVMTNIAFVNNHAVGLGGGLYNINNSNPIMTHVTFANNTDGSFGGGMYVSSSTPTLTNVLFWNSVLSGLTLPANQGNSVASSDPFFASGDPDGADNRYFTADDGLRLHNAGTVPTNSPLIDSGIAVSGAALQDILGNARDTSPNPGAYEQLVP